MEWTWSKVDNWESSVFVVYNLKYYPYKTKNFDEDIESLPIGINERKVVAFQETQKRMDVFVCNIFILMNILSVRWAN